MPMNVDVGRVASRGRKVNLDALSAWRTCLAESTQLPLSVWAVRFPECYTAYAPLARL